MLLHELNGRAIYLYFLMDLLLQFEAEHLLFIFLRTRTIRMTRHLQIHAWIKNYFSTTYVDYQLPCEKFKCGVFC